MRSIVLPERLREPLAALAGLAVLCALAIARGEPAPDAAPAAPPAPAWANDFTARLEALALLQTLNAELLSHDSATLTLDRWCDAHRLASPAKVVEVRERSRVKSATAEARGVLKVSKTEPIRYRRVQLMCGAHV